MTIRAHEMVDPFRTKGYDIITTGPIESLPDWMDVDVHSLLYWPSLTGIQVFNGYGARVHDLQFEMLGATVRTHGAAFKQPHVRQQIAARARRLMGERIMERVSINLRAEPVI